MKHLFFAVFLVILTSSCKGPEARRPIEVKSGSFLELSAKRNKDLLAREEATMQEMISKDSTREYISSSSGFAYYYESKNPAGAYTPNPDDWVTLTYDLRTWNEVTLYSREEIGIIRYKVDKMELFPGLRNSVKLLSKGESATFLYPSSLAFGYHGDNDRIGANTPIKCTLSIINIVKESNSN